LNIDVIAAELAGIAGRENIRLNESMAGHTSFKLGGPADILVTPGSTEILVKVYRYCKQAGIPLLVMGNGTNMIVREKGIRGVVIKLLDNYSSWEVSGERIRADAGILISKVARIALEHSLTGVEFAEGIPGTLGGAVVMNAGAYTGEMSGIVEYVDYLDKEGNIKRLDNARMEFGKRSSYAQRDGGVVLGAVLKLRKGDREQIKELMDEFCRQRREKQPLELPSAGSIFKRPEGAFAGKLIQDCGLRGYRIGGAEVSDKHCGFIVNRGGASPSDVISLIEHIRDTVYKNFGIKLEPEVKIVGEE